MAGGVADTVTDALTVGDMMDADGETDGSALVEMDGVRARGIGAM